MAQPKGKECVAGHATTNRNEETTENHTLEESSGPSDQAVPNCVAHVIMLTEKINVLRCCANEGCQMWHNDPVHILDISSNKEEEVIPACVTLPTPSPTSEINPPPALGNQSLEGASGDTVSPPINTKQ